MKKKTNRVRTTISLTPEVHAVFKRMAEAGNTSISVAMGDWLGNTCEAAELITVKMEEAKRAPMLVMKELQAVFADASAYAAEVAAPSSNTGLKSKEVDTFVRKF